MPTRRAFLGSTAALVAGAAWPRRARAVELDGPISHPVDPPPTLTFETMSWEHTAMYGGPSNAVVATPTGLAPGERVPLIVLLPGGAANMQGAVTGFWSWWSEYMLGDTDVALHRGHLTEKDFQGLVRPDELASFNRQLAASPYRGAVYVTPWVVGRQLDPAPHGHMVAEFLRDLVARVRTQFPVLPAREATGLGGMSSGGMWALYSGSLCADLFGTLVAEQPFTDDLVPPLHDTVVARTMPQRVRIVTSVDDHQKKSTTALSEALAKDGIAHDLVEYLGSHSAQFAAGPGGIDALVYFDRVLRGENPDGTKPLPSHDGLAHEVAVRPDRSRPPLDGAGDKSSGVASAVAWTVVGVGAAATGMAWARAKKSRPASPMPASAPAPAPASTRTPVPASALTPVPAPVFTPAPATARTPAPALTPTPGLRPTPTPAPALTPAVALSPTPAATPAPAAAPAPAPAPALPDLPITVELDDP